MTQGTGKLTHLIAVRLDDDQLAALKAWRREQDDMPNNAEAIRRLMLKGMGAAAPTKKPKPARK
jgi:hypothetical protein